MQDTSECFDVLIEDKPRKGRVPKKSENIYAMLKSVGQIIVVKLQHCEKAKKFEKNLPLVLTFTQ